MGTIGTPLAVLCREVSLHNLAIDFYTDTYVCICGRDSSLCPHGQVSLIRSVVSREVMLQCHRRKFQPVDGTCSVCLKEVGGDLCGVRGTELEDSERCLPPPLIQ